MEKNEIYTTAYMARLRLNEDEALKLENAISKMLEYFEKMNYIVEDVSSTTGNNYRIKTINVKGTTQDRRTISLASQNTDKPLWLNQQTEEEIILSIPLEEEKIRTIEIEIGYAYSVNNIEKESKIIIRESGNYVFLKPNAEYPDGGIIKKEAPVHISNLMLLDPSNGEATRVGRKLNEDNKLVRYAKKSNKEIK